MIFARCAAGDCRPPRCASSFLPTPYCKHRIAWYLVQNMPTVCKDLRPFAYGAAINTINTQATPTEKTILHEKVIWAHDWTHDCALYILRRFLFRATIPERKRAHVVNQTMPKGKRVARYNLNRHVRDRRAPVCPRENELRAVT